MANHKEEDGGRRNEMNTNELAFGGVISVECDVCWGARALYEDKKVILLWDRQDCKGDETECKKLCRWVNRQGLPKLRKHCKANHISTRSEDVFKFDDGEYHFQASPRASYGYYYITAYKAAGNEENK